MSAEKTHWKKAFKSDYLSSADIDDQDVILTIDRVIYKECVTASGKKFCNVAYFKEPNYKPMILNVTNSKTVKKFSGGKQHLEDWQNIPIRVYVDAKVKFGSETVEGLRIRETQPTTTKPGLTPECQAWANAVKYLHGGGSINSIKAKYTLTKDGEERLIKESLIQKPE